MIYFTVIYEVKSYPNANGHYSIGLQLRVMEVGSILVQQRCIFYIFQKWHSLSTVYVYIYIYQGAHTGLKSP